MNNLRYTLILFLLVIGTAVSAQCYPDRHSSKSTDSWISCSERISPNTDRGITHWIRYTLDETQNLGQLELWNYNDPEHLDRGIKSAYIDYSRNGIIWNSLGLVDFERSEGSGFYEGQYIADFDGASAKYILISVVENWGDPSCAGFAELRINSFDSTLPIGVANLSAVCDDGMTIISWTAAGSEGDAQWIIEASIDAQTWNQVKLLDIEPNLARQDYQIAVEQRLGQEHYYRLQSINNDGITADHGVVTSACSAEGISVYPNPFDEELILASANANTADQIVRLYDVTGRMIIEEKWQKGQPIHELDTDRLSSGPYWIILSYGQEQSRYKVVKP